MIKGKVWKYGDNINTDIISPPAYLELSIKDAAQYTMAPIDPNFAKAYQIGDLFVAEHNLGSGSSRETAPLMLKALGVRTVIAKDFARIFYRNCINIGILAIECASTDKIRQDDVIEVDYLNGMIYNQTTKAHYSCHKIPEHIMAIINHGGLIQYLKDVELKTT
ncbi:3-isopropylmalate dehydratase [Fusibacter paucivorans]|uniref:3-isopropylmalate dehydratase n=1 Tax=Fusibacter paucivorans TaxID=76009 RepID=A0ABS5PUU4_9FIRM|nr:3-isopropylmalate dehydratase [Fusibacter paucivorans]MBS7528199.1 3-isopropylmalate dehydratase [Fusibacter paucivorans]